jgi:hypothetical protein
MGLIYNSEAVPQVHILLTVEFRVLTNHPLIHFRVVNYCHNDLK